MDQSNQVTPEQESCAITKVTVRWAQYMGALKIFRTPWLCQRLLFPKIFHGLLFHSTLRMCIQKFEVCSFTQSWDKKKYPQNWAVLGFTHAVYPCSLFSKNFNGLLFGWTLSIYLPNLKTVDLPIPEIIGVAKKFRAVPDLCSHSVFPKNPTGLPYRQFLNVHSFSHNFQLEFWVGVANLQSRGIARNFRLEFWVEISNPQSWGKWGHRRSGMVPFKRALVSSYRHSIVTFSLSLERSDKNNFAQIFWNGVWNTH